MTFTRSDIQHVSDMRLIALSLMTLWRGDPDRVPGVIAMRKTVDLCDPLIRSGPPEFQHVLAETTPREIIERELRQAVFGRSPPKKNPSSEPGEHQWPMI